MHELYFDGLSWQGRDLTASTNGPPAQELPLTSFFDGRIEHVFYISQPYHVCELYLNGAWQGSDLTVDTNGPTHTPAR